MMKWMMMVVWMNPLPVEELEAVMLHHHHHQNVVDAIMLVNPMVGTIKR